MNGLNKVTFIGSVGKKPEIRQSADGKKIASFSLAINENYKDKNGEKKENTNWFNIVCFSSSLCDVIGSYVQKGSRLYVEGKLQNRKYTDKTGIERTATDVVLQNFLMLDKKESEGGKFEQSYDTSKNELNDEIPW